MNETPPLTPEAPISLEKKYVLKIQRLTHVEELKKDIEAEMERPTTNSWPACLSTQIANVLAYAGFLARKGFILKDDMSHIEQSVNEFKASQDELTARFPDRDNSPEDSEKDIYIAKVAEIAGAVFNVVQNREGIMGE